MLLTSAASADRELIRLTYLAAAPCPDEAAFQREIRQRASAAELASGARYDRHFLVTLKAVEAGFVGQLEIVDADGSTATREIDGEACDEVARAIAFVAAVAIQERAKKLERAKEKRRSAPPRPTKPSAPLPSTASSWRLGLSVELDVFSGPAPPPLVALGPRAEVSTRAPGWWAPSLAAAFLFARTGTTGPPADDADFRWIGGRLEACASRWALWSGTTLGPCAFADLAALRVEGKTAAVPGNATRTWAAAGALARVHFALGGKLFGSLHGGPLFPLTRDDFVFVNPRILVHDVPTLGFTAGLTVGLAFW